MKRNALGDSSGSNSLDINFLLFSISSFKY
uniref:Uncharacterized protein n=1 Tax=Rhizophora mucronata TaxID=61149 RepID=A0A2P2QPP7_RHIMU